MSVFRLLMRVYPAEFRRRYGAELEAAFRAVRGEPQHAGALGRLRFWAFVLRDLLRTAIRLRLRQFSTRSRPSLPARTSRTEMDTILQDVWYALRQFGRRPGFAAVAVLSLGMAIGANSLIYGLVEGLVLHPFPYPDPDRLVAVGVGFPRMSGDTNYVEVLSPAEYADIRTVSSFTSAAAFDSGTGTSPVATFPSGSSLRSCSTISSP